MYDLPLHGASQKVYTVSPVQLLLWVPGLGRDRAGNMGKDLTGMKKP